MKRTFLILFSFLPLVVFAKTSEEELGLRRIQALWQEKDYALTKKAIEDFLERFPEDQSASHLTLLLCDMALKEKNFSLAKELFEKLPKEKLSLDVRKRLWHILLHLGEFETLREETKELIDTDLEARFCFAEATFRMGLSNEKNKTVLLEEALSYLNSLKEKPSYSLESRASIIAIRKELKQEGEIEDEISALVDLIEEKKEINEDIVLFIVPYLQKNNPAKAEELLSLVLEKGTKKKKEASLLLFSLLTKSKEIETLLKYEKEFTALLDNDHLALYYFIAGRFYSEKKSHASAITALEKSLSLSLPSPYDKEALSRLGSSSFATGSLVSLEKSHHEFVKRYPNEAMEISKIELALASLYSEKGREKESLSLLDKMREKGVLLEEATIEKVKLLAKMKSWEEGNRLAEEYLSLHPRSLVLHQARLSLLSSWSQEDPTPAVQEKIASALEMACDVDEIFDREERIDLHVAYAHALLSCGKTKKTISHLESLLNEGESFPDIYLLLALAYRNEERLDKFVYFGERALLVGCEGSQKIHLPLFNAYLILAKEKKDPSLESKAAKHLLTAIHLENPITLDQRLWLFHRMAFQAHESGDRREIDEAISLMEPFIHEADNAKTYGREAIELLRLFAAKGDFAKATKWANKLSSFSSEGTWKYSDELLLATGDLYHLQKKNSEALDFYEKLQMSENQEVSFSATLKACKLTYDFLSDDKKKKESAEVKQLLATLKELRKEKAACTEPVHIEAALEYAEIAFRTFPKNEKEKKLLALLHEIKEEFLSETDLPSKDYHEGLRTLPEKRIVVESYLRYLDSWIYMVEGSLARRKEERESKEKMASLLLSSLKTEAPRSLREKAVSLEETIR